MPSPKVKSHKWKNDPNKRGEYRKFGDVSNQMREPVIKSMTEKAIAHAAVNGGSCRQGFVKDLVNRAAKSSPLMKISRDNINNKVRAIEGPSKQREVSLEIPYHDICCSSLSTNADSSVSTSLNSERTNVENLLDTLENQAVQILQPTSLALKSMQPTLPNRCLYQGCDAPFHLVPVHCSSCLRLVHQICQKFLEGLAVNVIMLLC